MAAKPPAIVTTSWDEGHPLDLRLADLLARYGVRGTFYVPIDYAGFPRVTPSEMRALEANGMEVGSHTMAHSRLPKLPAGEALRELRESRDALEQILGHRVRSFCFPEGKFSEREAYLLRMAGYELARTTVAFRTDLDFHPYFMPVTFQFWPHSRQVIIRHSLKEDNLTGLWNWIRRWQGETGLAELSERIVDYVEEYGGILHIWGHSWELEHRELWPLLERTLELCSGRSGIDYLTNIQVLEAVSATEEISVAMHA